jgi:four helix bundle protein
VGKIESHRDLTVWVKAMDLAVQVYRISGHFPADERFRLISQITTSAASVPANIAEGHARASRKEFANFLAIAKGSLMETETFMMLAVRLGYVDGPEADTALELTTQISKMLTTPRQNLVQTV